MLSEKFHLVKEGIGGLRVLEKYMEQISILKCDAIDIAVHFIEDICDNEVILSPGIVNTSGKEHKSESFVIPAEKLFGTNKEAKTEYEAFDAAKIVFEIEKNFYLVSPLLMPSMSKICNFCSLGVSDSFEKAIYLQFLFSEIRDLDSYVFCVRTEDGAKKIVSAYAKKTDIPAFDKIIESIENFTPEKIELSQDRVVLYSEFADSDYDFDIPAGFVLGKEIILSYTSYPRYKEMFTLRKADQDSGNYFYVGTKREDVGTFKNVLHEQISERAAGICGIRNIPEQSVEDFLNSRSFYNNIGRAKSRRRISELRAFLLKSA